METIAAIATAQSPSAIGIVRLSGEETRRVLAALFTPASSMAVEALPYRRMTYGDIRSADGTLLDRGMAVCFSAAHSYTGEESAELHCHGSPVVLSEVLQAAFAAGARQARPGEFTQRAFLNGKLDLTEAEAVIDLIDAETAESARNAAAQLSRCAARSKVFMTSCSTFRAVSTPSSTTPTRTLKTSRARRPSARFYAVKRRFLIFSARSHAGKCSKTASRPPSSARRTQARAHF